MGKYRSTYSHVCVHTMVYVLILSGSHRPRSSKTPLTSMPVLKSGILMPFSNNQDSLEKPLILDLGQGMCKINPDHLMIPQNTRDKTIK